MFTNWDLCLLILVSLKLVSPKLPSSCLLILGCTDTRVLILGSPETLVSWNLGILRLRCWNSGLLISRDCAVQPSHINEEERSIRRSFGRAWRCQEHGVGARDQQPGSDTTGVRGISLSPCWETDFTTRDLMAIKDHWPPRSKSVSNSPFFTEMTRTRKSAWLAPMIILGT